MMFKKFSSQVFRLFLGLRVGRGGFYGNCKTFQQNVVSDVVFCSAIGKFSNLSMTVVECNVYLEGLTGYLLEIGDCVTRNESCLQ